ncbi:MAG TPA: recombinase family protein [Polyangiaceae bacterium]|nr:recombinase family protein [Polyangiaceae bacterium]
MVRRKRVAKAGNPSLAIGYVRVSTKEQKLGPKGQAKELERWAKREGVTLLAVFVDHGVSGARPLSERPALLEALAALPELGAGVLLASKRDRLARDVTVAGGIESEAHKAGAVVRTADGTSDAGGSSGMLMRGLHDLLGAWEREVIRERTVAALAVKKARGERTGGIPYGFQVGGDGRTLEPNQAEQSTLAAMRGLRDQGLALRGIVERLNADGVPARGSRWHLSIVARLLHG